MMRVIYIGEGYAADRPGIDDDLRLGISAPLVYAAMEQIGLGQMIPAKRNNFRLLEPYPVRHMLPTLPRDDGQEGTKWADDVVPNVAKGIIDATYGRAVANNSIPGEEDEDDGLITNEEDETQDKMHKRLEAIQDELDMLNDNEAENHLYSRYVSDQPKEASEIPWFGDRFDWSTYETEKTYLTHLRKNWLVDDGRRDALKRSGLNKAKQECDEQGEEKADQPDDVDGKDTDMMGMDDVGDDEDAMLESSQFQRSSAIARLEKERSILTKDIRRHVYRASRRRNLPEYRTVRSAQRKRDPAEKANSAKAFKSNDMVEDTSSEDDDEKGGDDGDGDDEDEDENENAKYHNERFSDESDDDNQENDSYANHENDTKDTHDKTDAVPSTPSGQPTQLPLSSIPGHQNQTDDNDVSTTSSYERNDSPPTRTRVDVDSDPDRTDSE